MADKLTKENELQSRAFEMYYGLGDKRSLRAVAETIGRTERTVAGWSRAFNWVARVTQRNIENSQNKREEALNTQLTDVRARYRVIINNFMADLSKRVMKGEIKVRNIQDFERLVKLDLLLMGEPTDRAEIAGGKDVELSPADKARLDEIATLLEGFK
ncbi:hypothetical protein C3V36_10995 [Lachnospiraceae bacterium oral taxon 500]|nr:hypothetical protein C3V36_10995 [Lachnospiraceae bacterium oral taxon 500]